MNRAVWLVSTALAGLLSSSVVDAQQVAATDTGGAAKPKAHAPPPRSATVAPGTADIIVTAQKRSEALTTVPIAISAYTAESRQRIGIDSVSDYARFTPGLSYSPGADRVFIRGLGRQTNIVGSDAGVAVYSDGVYSASTGSAAGDTLFVDRTEVLRGPQGTLYGRNSIGGAINVISKRPTDSFYAEGRGTVANYGLYNLEAAVSGPISDGFRVRLAGLRTDQSDGYYNNLAGGKSEGGRGRNYYVEGQADADFAPNFDGWVKVFTGGSTTYPHPTNLVGSYDYSAFPPGALTPGAAFGLTTAGVTQAGTGTVNPGATDKRDFSADTGSRSHIHDNYGISGQLHYAGDGFDVRYIGGYQQYKLDSIYDLDQTAVKSYQFPLAQPVSLCLLGALGYVPGLEGCTPLTVFPTQTFRFRENKKFSSQEVDISSNGKGPLQWIVGGYYYNETTAQTSEFAAPDQPQLAAPAGAPANPGGDFVYAAARIKTRSYAGFGQLDWNVTRALKLTGGIRYTADKKSGTENFRELCFGLPACGYDPAQLGAYTPALDITAAPTVISYAPAPGVVRPTAVDPSTGIASRGLSDNWHGITGTAAVSWSPDPETLAYARYSRGYKSGGFNAGAIIAAPETAPEHVDSYEAGFKKRLGRTLQFNVDTFYYNYDNLQVPLTITPAGVQITSFANVPRARSYGAELEGVWSPVHNLQFLLSYAYLNAKVRRSSAFIDLSSPTPGGSAKGQNLPDSPRNKVALNGSYTLPLEPGSLTFSASYTWQAKSYGYVFNRSYTEAPSSDQVDLRILWTDKADRYTIIAFVKNVFNSYGYDSPVTVTGTAPIPTQLQVNLTPPRTFGAQLQVRFR